MSIFDNVTFMNEENYHNGPEYREYKRKEAEDRENESDRAWNKSLKSERNRRISGIEDKDLYDKCSDIAQDRFAADKDECDEKYDKFEASGRKDANARREFRKSRDKVDYSPIDLTGKLYKHYLKEKKRQSKHESAGIFESVEII